MAVNQLQVEVDLVWGPPPSSIYVPASWDAIEESPNMRTQGENYPLWW